jgi:hypothetical protein
LPEDSNFGEQDPVELDLDVDAVAERLNLACSASM